MGDSGNSAVAPGRDRALPHGAAGFAGHLLGCHGRCERAGRPASRGSRAERRATVRPAVSSIHIHRGTPVGTLVDVGHEAMRPRCGGAESLVR